MICGAGLCKQPMQAGDDMAADDRDLRAQASRLLSIYVKAAEDGLKRDSVMLCEMLGDEIQSVSLRVAAQTMMRSQDLSC